MTILDSIIRVLEEAGKPLTHKAIYDRIIDQNYYSFGAKDPVSVVRVNIRKHCQGLDFPSASPKKLFIQAGTNRNDNPLYDIWNKETKKTPKDTELTKGEALPEEIIHSKYGEHIFTIKSQLLDCINSADPAFFERLVVDLLLKMGYGWDGSLSGKVVGGAGDEGIDGIISEDKLGLENIYIQAKRYKKNKVPPSEIREFIGAMAMKGARKGVFFASSDFSEQAKNSAEKAQNMNITLINGNQLCEHLVQNEMGIAVVGAYKIFEIDRNFFEN